MVKKRKKRKIKKWVYVVLLICFLVAFLFTSFKFIKLTTNYNKTVNLVENLQQEIPKDMPIRVVNDEGEEEEVYTRDFEKLDQINSDTVGWIEIEDSPIDYPIVQTDNNNYYLTHSFNKKKNVNGWVFMNMGNASDLTNQNTVIFAHDSLFKYLSKLYNAKNKENPLVTIYQKDRVVSYEIFSIYTTSSNDVGILENQLSSYIID